MNKKYNMENIQTLLVKGFSDGELRRFSQYNSDFRYVYEQLASEMGKDKIIAKILNYAQEKDLLGSLLAWAKQENPNRYKAHAPYEIE